MLIYTKVQLERWEIGYNVLHMTNSEYRTLNPSIKLDIQGPLSLALANPLWNVGSDMTNY